MPKGFAKKVKEVVDDLDLPFQIKNVIHSKDPRNAVVKGCLTQAIISQKKMKDKAFARAVSDACRFDSRVKGPLSTKGTL